MGKHVRASELRAMASSELAGQLETLRKELWQAGLSVKEGALQQTHRLQHARRQIARIQTVLNEQQKAESRRQRADIGNQAPGNAR